MHRTASIVIGIALGAIAGVILATAATADTHRVLGRDLAWFEPYFRVSGIAAGGLILALAMVVIGIGVGRWRNPTPAFRRRDHDVHW
jgi:hypothetical protein